jgi:hypothetical protein
LNIKERWDGNREKERLFRDEKERIRMKMMMNRSGYSR